MSPSSPASLSELFSRHALTSRLAQERAAEVLGGHDWQMDLGAGVLTFDGLDAPLQVQLLGSFSKESATWLWAWANRHVAGAAPVEASRELCDRLGRDGGTAEFAAETFDVADEEGVHQLAAVCAMERGAAGYFFCPFDAGVAVVLFDPPDERLRGETGDAAVLHAASVMGELVSSMDFAHYAAWTSLLDRHDIAWEATDDDAGGKRLVWPVGADVEKPSVATFDSMGRLTDMQLAMGGNAE
jgi:hypothetical protein